MTQRWRWPAEWEPQDAVLLAWPHAGTDWAANLEAVLGSYTALVAAITRFEPVVLVVADAQVAADAKRRLEAADVPASHVRWVEVDYDDTWLRDSGPVTLRAGDALRLLDFRFTGWGGKFGAERDDRLVARLVELGLFRAEHRRFDLALEGGGIETDGAGTVLTTWRCLHQRAPDRTREEFRTLLAEALHAHTVHILEHGALEGDDTDAHIDTLARFASPTTIVHQGCEDPTDAHHAELGRMAAELAALARADGSPYEVVALPWAGLLRADDGRRLAASYANFLIIDGAVLMPAYGVEADARAAAVLSPLFPGRRIVPVPCRPLIEQNGSLHCVTMQLPRGVLA